MLEDVPQEGHYLLQPENLAEIRARQGGGVTLSVSECLHSGFRPAGREGRGLGFAFLPTWRQQGNRGVSRNRSAIAELCSKAGGRDGHMSRVPGQHLAGTSSRNRGKPVPEKPHLSAPAQFSTGFCSQRKWGPQGRTVEGWPHWVQ